MKNRRKTRNQRKLEMRRTILATVVMLLLWVAVLTMCVKAWDAEEVMTGYDYLESIGGDPYVFQD